MAGLELIGFLTEQQQAKEASPEYQTSPTSSQSVKEPTNLSIAPAWISPTPSIKKEQCSSSLTPGCSPSKLVERAIAFTKPGPNDEFIAEMGAIRAAEVDAEVDAEDETPQPLRKSRTMNHETRRRLLYELGGFGTFGASSSNFQESDEERARAEEEFNDGVSAYLLDQVFDKSRSRIWKIGWLEQAEQVAAEFGEGDEQ